MNRLLIMLAALFVTSTSYAHTFNLVTLNYPPYEYKQDGKLSGFAAEIVEEAFKRMGHEIKVDVLPWARALQRVKIGSADAIFTAYLTEERTQFLDYSKEVVMPQEVSFFTLKSSPIQYNGDLSVLADSHIGLQIKLSYGDKFDSARKAGLFKKIKAVSRSSSNFKKLLAGRLDVIINNKYGAMYQFKQLGVMDQVRELKPAIQSVPSYIAFSKKRQLSKIRDLFDIELRKMKEEGRWQQIIDNYFGNENKLPELLTNQ